MAKYPEVIKDKKITCLAVTEKSTVVVQMNLMNLILWGWCYLVL